MHRVRGFLDRGVPLALALLLVTLACSETSAPAGGRNHPPVVTITSPAPGTSIAVGTPLGLGGSATDAEDGTVPPSALAWSSSIDGPLGTGDTLTLTSLSIGSHTLTLTATDDSGATGSATRGVTVLGSLPVLGLDTVATGLAYPVFLTAPPGDASRLFIVEKTGTIDVIKNGVRLVTPFLDITDSVVNSGEQGFLSMAFAPDYATSGRFYVSYVSPHGTAGTSVVARYLVSGNPDVADPTTGQTILTVDQPYTNHNGGLIAFGPDGQLYFGLGDGGSGGDPQGHGQSRTDLLGSILRIDVSGSGTYTIPATNPYFNNLNGFRQELWNYGLRNPWRWSFDRQTHDLYIGDVGQNLYEEVDVQPAASGGGENYGWNVMEGLHCYNAAACTQTGMTLPVLEFDHSGGACSITGGYVYRGAAIPSLQGHYLYADYCAGWVKSFRWLGGAAVDRQDRPDISPGSGITSFGEDANGELYILRDAGIVYRVVQK
jgi:glucose/arabinose dehydrogenase